MASMHMKHDKKQAIPPEMLTSFLIHFGGTIILMISAIIDISINVALMTYDAWILVCIDSMINVSCNFFMYNGRQYILPCCNRFKQKKADNNQLGIYSDEKDDTLESPKDEKS